MFTSNFRIRISFLSFALVVVLAGCQSSRLHLNPRQEQVREAINRIEPEQEPRAAETPIIDVHTHTFNARYLPLEHVLKGKRDAALPFSALLSDHCAETLSQAIIERTELAPTTNNPGVLRPQGRRFLDPSGSGPVCRVLIGLINKAERKGVWDKTVPQEKQLEGLHEVAKDMNAVERTAIRSMMKMMGMEDRLKDMESVSGLSAAVQFIWQLTQNDATMAAFFRREYGGVPMRGRPLMVSHMMDLGPVYDQPAQAGKLLEFQTEQVRRMEAFQNDPAAGMIYFTAYNPYRDHWRGGSPGDALRAVQSAVHKHGAWGVKFYPPSGYRPTDNAIVPRPRAIFNRHAGIQWDGRYGGFRPDPNAGLNRTIWEFLQWCVREDVPVFVHSGTGEFEARKGYGLLHSHPKYWREFLKKNPRLRLCLGHAGGDTFWFGGKKNTDWGEEVVRLCREFPNVYAEVTTHSQLLDADKRAYFADLLIHEFKKDPTDGSPRLSEKLIYGTDWYLPDAAKRSAVLRATQQVFLHEKLEPNYEDYFWRNAARFLDVRERLSDISKPVGPEVRARLLPFADLHLEQNGQRVHD